jgi:hypothetical protein
MQTDTSTSVAAMVVDERNGTATVRIKNSRKIVITPAVGLALALLLLMIVVWLVLCCCRRIGSQDGKQRHVLKKIDSHFHMDMAGWQGVPSFAGGCGIARPAEECEPDWDELGAPTSPKPVGYPFEHRSVQNPLNFLSTNSRIEKSEYHLVNGSENGGETTVDIEGQSRVSRVHSFATRFSRDSHEIFDDSLHSGTKVAPDLTDLAPAATCTSPQVETAGVGFADAMCDELTPSGGGGVSVSVGATDFRSAMAATKAKVVAARASTDLRAAHQGHASPATMFDLEGASNRGFGDNTRSSSSNDKFRTAMRPQRPQLTSKVAAGTSQERRFGNQHTSGAGCRQHLPKKRESSLAHGRESQSVKDRRIAASRV